MRNTVLALSALALSVLTAGPALAGQYQTGVNNTYSHGKEGYRGFTKRTTVVRGNYAAIGRFHNASFAGKVNLTAPKDTDVKFNLDLRNGNGMAWLPKGETTLIHTGNFQSQSGLFRESRSLYDHTFDFRLYRGHQSTNGHSSSSFGSFGGF